MTFMNHLKYLRLIQFFRIRPKDGHMLFKGERVAMVPVGMFSDLYLGLTEVVGKGGAASSLYLSAKRSSPALYEIAKNLFGETALKSNGDFSKFIDDLISLAGFGRCEVVKADLENPEIEIVIHLWGLLTPSRLQESDVPVCHAERGAMTGIIEQILGKPLFGKETKCQAMGDEYCEFVITSIQD